MSDADINRRTIVMSRTVRTKVYKFNELSDAAKETAISEYSGVNIDYNWWQFTYEDAANIGLEITGFDLDQANYCTGKFTDKPGLVADNLIENHGENTDTYKTAAKYIADYNQLVEKLSDGINKDVVAEDKEGDFDDAWKDLDADFLQSLLEDYKKLLREEYEYLTSDQAIQDTIIANEYEFTKDGKRFNY